MATNDQKLISPNPTQPNPTQLNLLNMTEQYKLYPENKHSVYTKKYWCNELSDGTPVTVLHVQVWRSGIFTVELDETEKEKILAQDEIVLNEYGVCVDELYDGTFHNYKILNTCDEEVEEILEMMFRGGTECEFDEDMMDENGWSLDDTIYKVMGGVELEPA